MSSFLLDLQQCTVQFGGLTAVSKFDLQIGENDLVGLIGPNGAGKTTVFNMITGVYRPTSGTVTFEGRPIAGSETERDRRSRHCPHLPEYSAFPHADRVRQRPRRLQPSDCGTASRTRSGG